MFQWLHRYIFRGAKVLFAVGMIAILALAVVYEMHQSREHRSSSVTRHGRPAK